MMWEYENGFYEKGMMQIAGVDEAGRGPLAGPVVAAAVILPRDCRISGIKDSKKLSAKKREELCAAIKEEAIAYGIGIIGHREIDEINILEATRKAMIEALKMVESKVRIEHVLIDAVHLEDLWTEQTSIIKGDDRSISIAAASILAKVSRDELMVAYSREYPGYGFEKHKGYGTKAHYQALRELGLCPIHRHSFLRNFT